MSAYYRHSGRFSLPRLAIVLPIALVAAAVLALAYGYLFAYLPIVGYVSFIIAAGFGLLLGLGIGVALQGAHVRSLAIALVVGLIVTGFAYYVSWVVWVHAIAGRADVDIPMMELATSPVALVDLIVEINKVGVMTIKGWTPRGFILMIFWCLELILIFGPALYMAIVGVRSLTYCEECKRWCVDVAPIDLGETDLDATAERLERGDLDAVTTLPPRGPESWTWTRVDLKRCECQRTNTLSVSKVWIGADDKGNHEEKSAVVIDRLLIDKADAARVDACRT